MDHLESFLKLLCGPEYGMTRAELLVDLTRNFYGSPRCFPEDERESLIELPIELRVVIMHKVYAEEIVDHICDAFSAYLHQDYSKHADMLLFMGFKLMYICRTGGLIRHFIEEMKMPQRFMMLNATVLYDYYNHYKKLLTRAQKERFDEFLQLCWTTSYTF